MKVDRTTKICDIPIKAMRDFLKRYRTPLFFSRHTLSEYFGVNETFAILLCDELINQGFIEKKSINKYVVTVKGNALAQKKFVTRLNKKKADIIFTKFMERIKNVNSNRAFLYRVKQLFLFGSYLDSTANDFGDIDIAFVLERKINDNNRFEKAHQQLIIDAHKKGKRFSSIVEEVTYSETLTLQYLKNRSPYISLHRLDDVLTLGASKRQIYP